MNDKKTLAFADMTWKAVDALDVTDHLVIWPVASLEQHGPHLPLGTDSIILDAITRDVRINLGKDFQGIFLPQLWYGKSPEHLSFPGTVSLSARTLISVIEDIVASLVPHNFKNFVFLNGHGGNTTLLDSISYDLSFTYNVEIYHVNLWGGELFDELITRLFPALEGTEVHAASVETSLLMHLAPDLVKEIPHFESFVSFKNRLPASWVSHNFDTMGVIGDPSYASVEAGIEIFDYAVTRVCNLLKQISANVVQPNSV